MCDEDAVSLNGGALVADYRCPAGYWCEEGTATDPPPNACPKGTYQPNIGARK